MNGCLGENEKKNEVNFDVICVIHHKTKENSCMFMDFYLMLKIHLTRFF